MKKSASTPAKESKKSTKPPEARNRHAIWRIHQIDALLRAGKSPNTTWLAAKLETSRRSIERDIEFMRDRLNLDRKSVV